MTTGNICYAKSTCPSLEMATEFSVRDWPVVCTSHGKKRYDCRIEHIFSSGGRATVETVELSGEVITLRLSDCSAPQSRPEKHWLRGRTLEEKQEDAFSIIRPVGVEFWRT